VVLRDGVLVSPHVGLAERMESLAGELMRWQRSQVVSAL